MFHEKNIVYRQQGKLPPHFLQNLLFLVCPSIPFGIFWLRVMFTNSSLNKKSLPELIIYQIFVVFYNTYHLTGNVLKFPQYIFDSKKEIKL